MGVALLNEGNHEIGVLLDKEIIQAEWRDLSFYASGDFALVLNSVLFFDSRARNLNLNLN